MKNFFENLFIHFEFITHPASGWFKLNNEERKRKGRKAGHLSSLSPECFNVRGTAAKKGTNPRHTPAP